MGRRKLMEIEIPRVAAPLPPEMPAEAKTIFVPVPTEPETPDEVQDEKDVNKFFQAFGVEGGRVRVYRVDPNTGQLVFMATCTVDVISEEFLQVQFGGGKYEVRLFDSKAKYVTSKRMNIGAISGGPDNTPKPSIFVTPNAASPAHPFPDRDGYNVQVEMLRQELSSNREMMLELIRTIAAKSDDGGGSTLVEFATAMKELKEVTKPEISNPLSMVADIIGVLKQGIELGASGAVKPEGDGGWMGIIKDVLTAIPAVAKTMVATPPAASNPPAIDSPPVEVSPNSLGLSAELMTQLRGGLDFLKTRCRLNKDPALWSDMIIDNMDSDLYVQLAKLSALSIDNLASAVGDPEIALPPFRSWFEAVMKGVQNALAENDASAGTVGDDSIPASDGGAGTELPRG